MDVRINNLHSLIRSGMDYLRQGDFHNAEEQTGKILDLDASRAEGWLLKAGTSFDIAQADKSFANGLRNIGDAERQEFAGIFKELGVYVWKQANSMLVRDAQKRGMSRAAKQHYEIKAKAAQLAAFSMDLYPLSGWETELANFSRFKAWNEHTEAEQIELFDMSTSFDSRSASNLDAFIACRDRFIKGFAAKLPEEYTEARRRVRAQSRESQQGNTRRSVPTEQSSTSCFVATELYRSNSHPKVVALRVFRDHVLMQAPPGRALVDFYYGGAGERASRVLASLPVLRPILLTLMYPVNALVRFIIRRR